MWWRPRNTGHGRVNAEIVKYQPEDHSQGHERDEAEDYRPCHHCHLSLVSGRFRGGLEAGGR